MKMPVIPAGVRNDASVSTHKVAAILEKDGVQINYGDIGVIVERRMLEDAREQIAAYDSAMRHRMTASVDKALRKALPKIQRGRFSKKVADNFHADLLLWHALKESSA